MKLIAITSAGAPEKPIENMPKMAADVLNQTASMYAAKGYAKPWVGYLAVQGGECIGFCGFKSAPENNAVEIAYFTMPEYEGRGVATGMAQGLITLARNETPDIIIRAQTLPEENASTSILKRLGFSKFGDVMHPEDGLVWEWRLAPNL